MRGGRAVGDDGGSRPTVQGAHLLTEEELIVEFALARLDHPALDLEEVATVIVRRGGRDLMLQLASQNLAVRGELRGGALEAAVECVVRTVLKLRDDGTG